MIGLTPLAITVTGLTPLRIDGVGIDVCRDWAGHICIPATMLKGLARSQVRRLATALAEPICEPTRPCTEQPCAVCRLFGSQRFEASVIFTDLLTNAQPTLIDRPRIARSRMRGVNLPGEPRQVLVLSAETVFSGVVRHRLTNNEPQPTALFVASLRAIRQIGAGAAVGWGRCDLQVSGIAVAATVGQHFKTSGAE